MFRSARRVVSPRAIPYLVIALLMFFLGGGAARATPAIDIFRLADGANASQLAKVDASGNVATNVSNFPTNQSVTVTNASVPVTLPARTLVSDGEFFSVTALVDPNPSLTVPSGVVLTDARISFSVPENIANAASLFVSDGQHIYVYQLINDTTFEATVHLESGILSEGGLSVALSCYNIATNHCQGAIMWSGYRP